MEDSGTAYFMSQKQAIMGLRVSHLMFWLELEMLLQHG